MQSKAKNVEEYLAGLPEDRREAITAIREVILKNLPKGYEEGMQWGMPSYFVPLSAYPGGYNRQPDSHYRSLGSLRRKTTWHFMGSAFTWMKS